VRAIKNVDSFDATLFSNRSLCFIKMGKGLSALLDAEACRLLQPNWPEGCFRQGSAHMLLQVMICTLRVCNSPCLLPLCRSISLI
jgi:hypothetical protein